MYFETNFNSTKFLEQIFNRANENNKRKLLN